MTAPFIPPATIADQPRLRVQRCWLGGISGDHDFRTPEGVCLACGDGALIYQHPDWNKPSLAAARQGRQL